MRCEMNLQPWYWRSLPLAQRTGSEVFAALFRSDSHPEAIATLLESPYPTPKDYAQLARYSICAGAPRFIDGQPQLWTPPVGKILPFLEQLLQRGQADKGDKETKRLGVIPNLQFPHSPPPLLPDSRLPTPYHSPAVGWVGWDMI